MQKNNSNIETRPKFVGYKLCSVFGGILLSFVVVVVGVVGGHAVALSSRLRQRVVRFGGRSSHGR